MIIQQSRISHYFPYLETLPSTSINTPLSAAIRITFDFSSFCSIANSRSYLTKFRSMCQHAGVSTKPTCMNVRNWIVRIRYRGQKLIADK